MIVDRAETTSDSPENLVRLATTGANSDLNVADVNAGSRGRVVLILPTTFSTPTHVTHCSSEAGSCPPPRVTDRLMLSTESFSMSMWTVSSPTLNVTVFKQLETAAYKLRAAQPVRSDDESSKKRLSDFLGH